MNVTRPVTYITSIVDEGPTESPDTPTTYVHFVAPAGIETGDFMLAGITTPLGEDVVITPPDGWTLIQHVQNSSSLGLALYYRFALDEPDRYVWSMFDLPGEVGGVDSAYIGTMSVYRNVWDFAPVDAFAGQRTASGTTHALPTIGTATESNVAVAGFWAINGTDTGAWTAPSGWRERQDTINTDGATINLSMMTADAFTAAPGSLGLSATWSATAGVGCSAWVILTPTRDTVSADEADKLYKAQYPPGAESLYDWESEEAEIRNLIHTEAEVIKDQGYDLVDMLREEISPRRATVTLDEWENALGLGAQSAPFASQQTSADRRAAIVGKWRENGAVTLRSIRDALAPLLRCDPDDIEIVECDRAALRALHTLASGTINSVIPGSGQVVSELTVVIDDAPVSAAGAQVDIVLTHPSIQDLTFALTSPDASFQITAAGILGSGAVTAETFRLFFSEVAGFQLSGTWEFAVASNGAAGTLVSWELFVEGAGLNASDMNGHGGEVFTWAAAADTTLVGDDADWDGAMRAIRRIQPAYSAGFLVKVDPAEASGNSVFPETRGSISNANLAIPAARPDGGGRGTAPAMIGSRGFLPATRP